MRTRLVALLGLVVIGPGVVACVSLKPSPEARFFVLRSLVEPPGPPPPEGAAGTVGVLPVRLAGHLQRGQVVSWQAPNEVRIDEFVRWAEPLDAGTTRTLVENLARLLPDHRVVAAPWPSALKTRCRVAVEVSVFGLQRDGEVALDGRWTLLPDREESPLMIRPIEMRRGPLPGGPEGTDPGAGVDAMSELLADVCRQIADGIRALPPPEERPVAPEQESVASEDVEGR